MLLSHEEKVESSHVAKGQRCSTPHLVHTVQELQEDGREAAALAAGTQVAPLAKLVAKRQPLFL